MYKYPFGITNTGSYKFLKNEQDGSLFFSFKDDKNIEFALVDTNFKSKEKLQAPISDLSLKSLDDDYRGGVINGTKTFLFFKKEHKNKINYAQITVDFNSKSFSSNDLILLPESEKLIFSFTHHNRFFILTADDNRSELVVYKFDKDEKLQQKHIPFVVPTTKNKRKNELSEFISNLNIIKDDEEPDLELATNKAKLFSLADKLILLSNKENNTTHIIEIDVPSLSFRDKDIDHTALLNTAEKEDASISSFYKDGKLYSLALNKTSIRLGIYDAGNGSLLKTHEINETNAFKTMTGIPISQSSDSRGKKEDPVDDFKKLIKTLNSNTDGLMLTTNKKGQLILTVGTYDVVLTGGGGSGGPTVYAPTSSSIIQQNANNAPIVLKQVGGQSTSFRSSGAYYKSTFFRVLIDPTTYNIAKGRIPLPVNEQIESYLETLPKSKKSKTRQFSVGDKYYHSYYDKEEKAYIFEQIRIIF